MTAMTEYRSLPWCVDWDTPVLTCAVSWTSARPACRRCAATPATNVVPSTAGVRVIVLAQDEQYCFHALSSCMVCKLKNRLLTNGEDSDILCCVLQQLTATLTSCKSHQCQCNISEQYIARKRCYRKGYRAMRHLWMPWKFIKSMATSMGTIAEIGSFSRSQDNSGYL